MSAPLPDTESERLGWLHQSGAFELPASDAFDDITSLIAQVCGVPIAAVSLIDEDRQWFQSATGLGLTQTPRALAFCAYTILEPDTLVVPDATQDARFRDNPLVTGPDHYRFYAGAPLITSDGFALGSLCVIDRVPRQLTAQQDAVLKVMAGQVASRIELRRRIRLQEQLVAEQKELLLQKEQLIAERAQAMEASVRSEQRLLFAIDHAGIGTWSWDLSGDDLGWSDTCKALFGLTRETPVTREVLYNSLHPDDRERTRQAIERAMAEGTAYDNEYRAVWPDGSEHWLTARGRGYYGKNSELLRFDGTIQDIDEKKRARERQRQFLRDVLASVTEGRLVLCSSSADLPAPYASFGPPIALSMAGGLRELRHTVQSACQELSFSDGRCFDLITAASEAGMNAAVHVGSGEGLVTVDGANGTIQVRVTDSGSGITLENLPHATLMKGYSSAGTLGHGMKMILQTADRLFLLTSPLGTTAVIEQNRVAPVAVW